MSYLKKIQQKVITKVAAVGYMKKINSNTKEVPALSLFEFVIECDDKAFANTARVNKFVGKDAAMSLHDSLYDDIFNENNKEDWEKAGVVFTNDGYKCLIPPQVLFGQDIASFLNRINEQSFIEEIGFRVASFKLKFLEFVVYREVKYFTLNKLTYYGINN